MTKTLSSLLTVTLLGTGAALAGTGKAPGKAAVPPPPPADELLGFTLSTGFDSHYIFHGVNVGEQLLWEKLEFAMPLTDKLSLTAGQWFGHLFDYTYNELDLYAGLTYAAGPVNVSTGFTWYHYLDGSVLDNQYEPFVTIASATLPVDVYFSYFYDFEVDGHYLELGIGKTFKVNDTLSIVASSSLGYNIGYNSEVDDFNHVGIRLGFPISLSRTATLTPYIGANFALEATEGVGVEDDIFQAGISLAVKF
ncbi:MAG: hypothetical protein KA004_09390 [Verrucomicrobiales bacterium]|nr:hypothetical protein [Verrucomicrobiales bacterium]